MATCDLQTLLFMLQKAQAEMQRSKDTLQELEGKMKANHFTSPTGLGAVRAARGKVEAIRIEVQVAETAYHTAYSLFK